MKGVVLLVFCLSSQIYAADKNQGKQKYEATCAGCHGTKGQGTTDETPNLAGQKSAYLTKQLRDFKSLARQDPTMKAMADTLTDNDIANIAIYLSSLNCK